MIAEREKLKVRQLQINCLSNITHASRKFSCFNCKKQITNYTMIFAQNNIFCIVCIAKQKKFPSNYNIINKLQFPIFEQDWTAKQELLLFQGLQKHGFGNWNEIAEYIDSNKGGQNVERHYNKIYLSANGFIPEPNSNFVKKDKTGYKLNRAYHPKAKINKQVKNRITTNSIRGKTKQPGNSKQSPVQIVGYMPLRKDFQFQYDNEAQLLLAEMQFSQEDTAQEIQLKFRTIQIYNKRLTQRNKRKQFVISRGLLDLEKQTNLEKMRTRNEKQIYNMMKCFARFQIAQEHEQLVQGIIRQKQLKQTIQQYKDLRNKGFLTKEEIDAELQRRKQAKTKKKNTNQYGYAIANYDLGRNRRQKDDPQTNGINKKNLNTYFNADELQLCRSLKLSPVGFMMIKETILREYAKLGSLEKEYILNLFNVQKYVVVTILNSMVSRRQVVCRG